MSRFDKQEGYGEVKSGSQEEHYNFKGAGIHYSVYYVRCVNDMEKGYSFGRCCSTWKWLNHFNKLVNT